MSFNIKQHIDTRVIFQMSQAHCMTMTRTHKYAGGCWEQRRRIYGRGGGARQGSDSGAQTPRNYTTIHLVLLIIIGCESGKLLPDFKWAGHRVAHVFKGF